MTAPAETGVTRAPRRIAMVSEHASPLAVLGGVDAGGQNVHVAALASALADRGHEVVVYTRRDAVDLPARTLLRPGVEVVHVDAGPAGPVPKDDLVPFMPAFAEALRAEFALRRPDVVHAHFWMSGTAALPAAREHGVPVVQTFHALGSVKRRYQGSADTSPPERLDAERRLARDVDLVIATCRDEVAELRAAGAPPRRVQVVPCGVDTARFAAPGEVPADVVGPRRSGCRTRLLSVGRLVPRKGVEAAVRALELLPDAELVVAGGPAAHDLDGDHEAVRLQKVAVELGIADRVRLVGRVSPAELPALLASADALLATPWYEPFGIAVLEAMAAGVPVVASAVGGMLDTVRDGVTGRLVPVDDGGRVDPVQLASAVRAVVEDPAVAARLGAAGREVAVERYDWARVAAATESAYELLLEEGTGAVGTRAYVREHVAELQGVLSALERQADRLDRWGRELVRVVDGGGRLLVAGNGGSAAEAQHLTAELVGRFMGERRPLSAIALHAETSTVTAIANDYGVEEVFARQVEGHGRPGDVLLLMSASGRSPNLLRAAERARECGLRVWAMTTSAPNPLVELSDDAVVVPGPSTSAVQEGHLMAVHTLCVAVEAHLPAARGTRPLDLTAVAAREESA
ncbi:glycosyltransferase [Paenibacillus sp. TRM 82003]|uniref:glycosyltransferase n=1 Tax=Kineococcus sp. TRM81007 TaxID=2925831 RepID=UPI001F5A2505|nr:glycosyltransferase [Kineococcus sp. TRM81007]MCI2240676.1 glycosyltransferase [Kineococcus sp. TRM81007]MCI3925402.1 glycosyltransferase [Paenibacillus sp. TRM 82003]